MLTDDLVSSTSFLLCRNALKGSSHMLENGLSPIGLYPDILLPCLTTEGQDTSQQEPHSFLLCHTPGQGPLKNAVSCAVRWPQARTRGRKGRHPHGKGCTIPPEKTGWVSVSREGLWSREPKADCTTSNLQNVSPPGLEFPRHRMRGNSWAWRWIRVIILTKMRSTAAGHPGNTDHFSLWIIG